MKNLFLVGAAVCMAVFLTACGHNAITYGDGIGFDAAHLVVKLLEEGVLLRVKATTQLAEQAADAGDRIEAKGLTVSQTPLVDSANQQGHAQGFGFVAAASLAPVEAAWLDFGQSSFHFLGATIERETEDTGESILSHTCGQALNVLRSNNCQLVSRQRSNVRHRFIP